MKLKKILLSTFLFFVLLPLTVFADEYDKKREEVKQLVDSGVEYLRLHSIGQARITFSDPKDHFMKGELYLFVIDFSGMLLIQAPDPSRNHTHVSHLKDKNGHYFVQEMTTLAKTDGSGWVKYEWMNYQIHKVMNKQAYVKRVPGKDYYVGSGFYTN